MNLRKGQFEWSGNSIKVFHDEMMAKEVISNQILSALPSRRNRDLVVVCIGTDRSTGDSLGPLTGTFLEEKAMNCFTVYGTLDAPIHALNLEEKIEMVYRNHHHPFVIAVDACLGKMKSVGMIQIGDGPVKPGAGVKKELPPVGDIHITGIVNISGFMEFTVLQNTRLNLVLKMAKLIAAGISRANLHLQYQHSMISLKHDQPKEKLM
ncbi:spore protease YyaC [Heyndrickxia acidiproducens]|uniref:spore protease YyaC n=1 Tax=Heyndrickxia acidiproducens TaxID=1121084 RepID=UPI00036E01B8|nr:spore protease YyaC [Heyndrickxia acidiproducens]